MAAKIVEYKGRNQLEAARAMKSDAQKMAQRGYIVTSQQWAPSGGYGIVAGLVFCLGLSLFIFGFLAWPLWIAAILCVIVAIASPRRNGVLSVCWTLNETGPSTPAAAQPRDPSQSQASVARPEEALGTLKELLDRGLVTPEDYDTKKRELLARL